MKFCKFKMQTHNIIPVNIETFPQKYYLLNFPTVGCDYYDFAKCKFYNYGTGECVPFVLSASAPAPRHTACQSGRERTL